MKTIKFSLFLLLTFFFLAPKILFAKENSVTPLVITSPTAVEIKQSVNYELPYPGLLPDNPIYFLRIIRDKTVSFLIADPLKKAEFNLLQADKRLNAGIYLFNKGKISQALSTVSKAENYFGEALEKAKKARFEGMEVNGITRRLINSSKKHQEELDSLEKRSPQNFKENFKFQEKRSADFEREAQSLILKR